MDVGQVNSYSADASISSSTSSSGLSSSISTQDFLELLAAQMSNQDVMNPSSDTEFVSQLAQFSSLEAMQTLTQISNTQLGASLVGKTVAIASTDSLGNSIKDQGVVESANISSGTCTITIDGMEYALSSVTNVINA